MDKYEIFAHIDHTVLFPAAAWPEIEQAARDAERYGAASLCVAPAYVRRVREQFPTLALTTVVGFPFGFHLPSVKVFETVQALASGADEIDMVANLGDVKNRAFHRVQAEISEIKKTVGSRVLKVIVETCFLHEEEKIELCRVVAAGGADFIKTSTGFGTAGASVADIGLFCRELGDRVRVKAAGGIRSEQQMIELLEAGASRLGCSAGVKALFGE